MRGLTVLAFQFIIASIFFGQDLLTPEEFETLVRRSRIQYTIQPADQQSIPKIARELLPTDLYVDQPLGQAPKLKHYSDLENEKVLKNEQLGDVLTIKGNYEKARKHLEKALKQYPDHAGVMAKIGLTYFHQENYPMAKEWALNATKINYVHAPAHLLLANIYMKSGKREEAMEAITLAHIFNRNHREILSKLHLIYDANNKVYDDTWEFYAPIFVIGADSSKVVQALYSSDPWYHYCMCQAVWEHEPFYVDKKKIINTDLEMLREKECLLNLIIDYEHWTDAKAKRKFKIGPVLQRAIEQQLVDEFIIYEILLVKDPEASLMFTPEEIHRLAKYLFEVRSIHKD